MKDYNKFIKETTKYQNVVLKPYFEEIKKDELLSKKFLYYTNNLTNIYNLLKAHKNLINGRTLRKIVKKNINEPLILELFKNVLEDSGFQSSLKRNPCFFENDIFEILYRNEFYTKFFLEHGKFQVKYKDLYNQDVLRDKRYILKLLKRNNQNLNVYFVLKDELQKDVDICGEIEKLTCNIDTLNSNIKNIKDFEKWIKRHKDTSYLEMMVFFDKTKRLKWVWEDEGNIIEILDLFVKHKIQSEIDFSIDPVFNSHPILDFILENKLNFETINIYLESNRNFLENIEIKNYNSFENFEKVILKKIVSDLKICLNRKNIENKLKNTTKIEKIPYNLKI